MAEWSPGVFENDPASEWAGEVESLSSLEDVAEILLPIVRARKKDALEASDCARALAAAEVIAAVAGHPGSDLPEGIESWLLDHEEDSPSAEVVEQAIRAVQRVRANEELRDLFEGSEEYETWRDNLDELEIRLGA